MNYHPVAIAAVPVAAAAAAAAATFKGALRQTNSSNFKRETKTETQQKGDR